MKFQWYIINLDDATVVGTNDVEKAQPFISNDQYIVMTAQHGLFYNGSTDENEVEEIESNEEDEDGDDDGDDEDDEG